jgi:NDP-sugar pyrophosphorylase family protein
MQAILLATAENEKLQPLTQATPAPMLPIVNQPVMAYPLELLARVGFKEVLVSLYHQGGAIESYFGSGRRWGMRLNYVLQRQAWGSAGALKWAASLIKESLMVLPADSLVDVDLEAAAVQHLAAGSMATVVAHGQPYGPPIRLDKSSRAACAGDGGNYSLYQTGVYIFEPAVLNYIPARTPFDIVEDLLPVLLAAGVPVHVYQMGGYWNPLPTIQKYQAAQRTFLHTAAGSPLAANGTPPPRYATIPRSREISKGIWVGRNHVIHPSARFSAPVYIGDNCHIGRDVEVGPATVIGSHVIIDDGATVHESTVLDYTYVGELVHISHRLVQRQLMIDPASGEQIQVVDEFLLNGTHPAVVGGSLRRGLDMVVALLLIVLTLPLALGLGLACLLTSGRVFQGTARLYQGNGGEARTVYLPNFATRRKGKPGEPTAFGRWLERWELCRLPELWSVLKGDLALVGVKPLSAEEANGLTESWQQTRHGHREGFTGLWYVQTKRDSELDDVLIADAYYAATHNWQQDMGLLLRTPAAWWQRARIGTTEIDRNGIEVTIGRPG